MIIAVDGPAAAGKGTLARGLAQRFELAYLDTGSLYRAVAARLIRLGHNYNNEEAANIALSLCQIDTNDPILRDEQTGAIASKIATFPEVREALRDYQRNFAFNPPNGALGSVLDGRDIGTTVCPDADVKFFVTASLEIRADRRAREIAANGQPENLKIVRAKLEERDARDMLRATAPLRPAPDAHLLDTTNLDIESALTEAESLILARMSRPNRP